MMKTRDFNIESYFDDDFALPVNVYLKDRSTACLRANKRQCLMAGFAESPNDIIGKNNSDLIGEEFAKQITENDALIFHKRTTICIPEVGMHVDGKKALYLSIKMPYYGRHNKLQGLFGISLEITGFHSLNNNYILEQFLNPIKHGSKIVINSSQYEKYMQLSLRERQCLDLLLDGMTAKESAKILGIKYRSVESIIEKIKLKCNCSKKAELFKMFL